MLNKFDYAHMKAAETYAELSTAKRLKVGAVVVKNNRILSIGYNGMPAGWTNECEDDCVIYINDIPLMDIPENRELITKPEVIHAEMNCIGKLAKANESSENSSMYVTHSPCFDCAKLIHIAGISKVYYRDSYRNIDGIEFLNKCKIAVEKI